MLPPGGGDLPSYYKVTKVTPSGVKVKLTEKTIFFIFTNFSPNLFIFIVLH